MTYAVIPFNRPSFEGNEHDYITAAIASGHISGDGPFGKRCHAYLETALGVPRALLTTSCTHALEMTALLLNIKPGDEVILPSFAFVSTVNAFVLRGARPVFIDIRSDTLNFDHEQFESLITDRTKAAVLLHYGGVACEMDQITEVATRHRVQLVEDNAHGLFGRYRGRLLGTFGVMATQSFHETKNFSCGEGGALIINDEGYIARAEVIREKGTNRSRFFRGQVDKYTWIDLGSSYLPSDLLAAVLLAQFEARDRIQSARRRVWGIYRTELDGWAQDNNVRLPRIPSHCDQAYHMFYMVLPSLQARQDLIAHLQARGIMAVFHYLPLHLSEMGRRFDAGKGHCPITEEVSDRLLRLPFYTHLSETDQSRVIAAVREFRV